ncbi:RNA polymerase sigma factor [Streptomyces tsukubensis]|uniref:RNA polymerase sigma factor n=1 Tax=Streptomyces tsukubensis TaxID=83656 RepID=UPI00344D5590
MGSWSAERAPTAREAELGSAVRRAQTGDENAFRVVYAAVQPGLLRYLSGLVGADAEDVASDSWLEIARDLGRFRGSGAGFTAWARTIARHRAVDHLRRQLSRPRTTLLDHDVHEVPGSRDTAGEALESISTERTLALIAILPERQARAVLLRTVIGLDTATAARLLVARPPAVRSAVHRGLNGLARYLTLTGQAPVRPDGARSRGGGRGRATARAAGSPPEPDPASTGR